MNNTLRLRNLRAFVLWLFLLDYSQFRVFFLNRLQNFVACSWIILDWAVKATIYRSVELRVIFNIKWLIKHIRIVMWNFWSLNCISLVLNGTTWLNLTRLWVVFFSIWCTSSKWIRGLPVSTPLRGLRLLIWRLWLSWRSAFRLRGRHVLLF